MKLLLTSSGLTNGAIARALQDLTGMAPATAKIAFVPTAANAEVGDKKWLFGDAQKLYDAGYEYIDIVDPSAAGIDWRARLNVADIIFIGGGNTFHLLKQARETGFADWLTQHKDEKVYVGSGAGSILMTPTIACTTAFEPDNIGVPDLTGLNLVDFEFIPHVSSLISQEKVDAYLLKTQRALYAVDDAMAVSCTDEIIKVVGDGEYNWYESKTLKKSGEK